MKLSSFLRPAHLPAFAIMGTLFYLSSQPGNGMPPLHPPLDKIVHFFAYAILGGSFCLWVREIRWKKAPWLHMLFVCAACALFGASDEMHQSFVPGRSVSLGDFAADMGGSSLAIGLYVATRFYRLADRIHFSLRPLGLVFREPRQEK